MTTKLAIPKRRHKQGMLDNVMRQLDNAADIIGLTKNIRKILEVMNNEFVVYFPVRMDNINVRTIQLK